ncbi:hypothetical protein KCP74_15855 [Salmonella enterica subsp. enterica]|nr:hypothetical protein KCP74_15855 [Salmonella enterica subsp. enterica]
MLINDPATPPYHWQLAISANAGHLLRIERQVTSKQPRGFSRPICLITEISSSSVAISSLVMPATSCQKYFPLVFSF